MKYVGAVFAFLVTWCIVEFICTLALGLLFSSQGALEGGFTISSDWRIWPGKILGTIAGAYAAKAALTAKPKPII